MEKMKQKKLYFIGDVHLQNKRYAKKALKRLQEIIQAGIPVIIMSDCYSMKLPRPTRIKCRKQN
jgi:hypothetical protein